MEPALITRSGASFVVAGSQKWDFTKHDLEQEKNLYYAVPWTERNQSGLFQQLRGFWYIFKAIRDRARAGEEENLEMLGAIRIVWKHIEDMRKNMEQIVKGNGKGEMWEYWMIESSLYSIILARERTWRWVGQAAMDEMDKAWYGEQLGDSLYTPMASCLEEMQRLPQFWVAKWIDLHFATDPDGSGVYPSTLSIEVTHNGEPHQTLTLEQLAASINNRLAHGTTTEEEIAAELTQATTGPAWGTTSSYGVETKITSDAAISQKARDAFAMVRLPSSVKEGTLRQWDILKFKLEGDDDLGSEMGEQQRKDMGAKLEEYLIALKAARAILDHQICQLPDAEDDSTVALSRRAENGIDQSLEQGSQQTL